MSHFINPFSDWGFRRIFGQKIKKIEDNRFDHGTDNGMLRV